jgi:hypothetical protein
VYTTDTGKRSCCFDLCGRVPGSFCFNINNTDYPKPPAFPSAPFAHCPRTTRTSSQEVVLALGSLLAGCFLGVRKSAELPSPTRVLTLRVWVRRLRSSRRMAQASRRAGNVRTALMGGGSKRFEDNGDG